MKLNNKHTGLIVASLIALSFNSHFAQAAKKTVDAVKPATAYALKRWEVNMFSSLRLRQQI